MLFRSRSASSAEKSLQPRSTSKARPRPMSRGNRCVAPPPGTSPTATSGWLKVALPTAAKHISMSARNVKSLSVGAASKLVSHTRSFRLTQMIGERFRNMPKVTIAKIEGRARGGGSEIALAADMCFAAIGKAIFGQPEVAVGLVPGGGSTQRLPRLIGRGRALEVLLGCNDLSAELAERYG